MLHNFSLYIPFFISCFITYFACVYLPQMNTLLVFINYLLYSGKET